MENKTLGEYLDWWFDLYKRSAVRKRTADLYRYIVSIIKNDPCAAIPVTDVTEPDLQALLNRTAAAGYSKSVLEKVRYTLRQAYRPLARHGAVTTAPTVELILPRAPVKKVLPLTHEQQDAVEAACARDPLGHLIIFLLETGLRRGEMMALRWEHYDPVVQSIFVAAAKTPAGIRTVFLTSRAAAIVESQERTSDYIFTHTRGGAVTQIVMRRLVDRIRHRAGVPQLACHVCRHTFVTRLCEAGAPVKAIAQIIGHAKSDYVLNIYAQLEATALCKAIYVLDKNKSPSPLFGQEIHLPTSLFATLQAEADRQHISVDVLATFLLNNVIQSKKAERAAFPDA